MNTGNIRNVSHFEEDVLEPAQRGFQNLRELGLPAAAERLCLAALADGSGEQPGDAQEMVDFLVNRFLPAAEEALYGRVKLPGKWLIAKPLVERLDAMMREVNNGHGWTTTHLAEVPPWQDPPYRRRVITGGRQRQMALSEAIRSTCHVADIVAKGVDPWQHHWLNALKAAADIEGLGAHREAVPSG